MCSVVSECTQTSSSSEASDLIELTTKSSKNLIFAPPSAATEDVDQDALWQPGIGLSFHSSAAEDVDVNVLLLALVNKVRQPGAHAPNCSTMSTLEGCSLRSGAHSPFTSQRKVSRSPSRCQCPCCAGRAGSAGADRVEDCRDPTVADR